MKRWSKFIIGAFVVSTAMLSAGDMRNGNQSNDASSDMTGGMYIGGVVGPAGYNGAYKIDNLTTGYKVQYAKLGDVNVIAGGLLGVEGTFWKWGYAALEGNVAYDSLDNTLRKSYNTAGVVQSKLRVENPIVYGVDGKLGVMFEDTALYLVGGLVAGTWKMRVSNDSLAYDGGVAPGSSVSESHTKVNGKVGAGVRFPVCEQLKFDMQYSYNWFGTGDIHASSSTETYKHKVQYQQQKVLFSLNWEFWNFWPEPQATSKRA